MKITHNPNNRWQEEARMMGLDKDFYQWIESLLKEKDNQAVVAVEIVSRNKDKFFLEVLKRLKDHAPISCCDLAHNDALTEAKKKLTDPHTDCHQYDLACSECLAKFRKTEKKLINK